MFWVTRIFELLSATKKLNDSKTYVMSAVSNLMLVLLLGMFGIFLAAIMIAGGLYLIYLQLVMAGLGVLAATLCTAVLTLVILAAVGLWAAAVFGRVRADVEQVFHSQSPIIAPVINKVSPVINKVSNVAGSFLSGLRNKPQKAAGRARR